MLTEKLFDIGPVFGADVDEQNVLRGRQADLRLESLDNAVKARLKLITLGIADSAILDE